MRPRHPGFLEAVVADARIAAVRLGDRWRFPSRVEALLLAVRLSLITDVFLALVCYRVKAACRAQRTPVIRRFFHHLAVIGQVAIGDPVVVQPGGYLPTARSWSTGSWKSAARWPACPSSPSGCGRDPRGPDHRGRRDHRQGAGGWVALGS